jgi:hypothetical protein
MEKSHGWLKTGRYDKANEENFVIFFTYVTSRNCVDNFAHCNEVITILVKLTKLNYIYSM